MSKSVSSLSLHWKGIVFTCSFQTRVPLFPASDPPGSRTSCSQGGPAKDQAGAYLMAQRVKNLPAVQEIQVQSLGWEDSLEKGRATHYNILAWRIPWTGEPGRLQSMGLQRVGHD